MKIIDKNDHKPENVDYIMKGSGDGLELYKQIHPELVADVKQLLKEFNTSVKLSKPKIPTLPFI